MCQRGDKAILSLSGKNVSIDSCIAGIVAALNNHGIVTTASCCGNGKTKGYIRLKDGRKLTVKK